MAYGPTRMFPIPLCLALSNPLLRLPPPFVIVTIQQLRLLRPRHLPQSNNSRWVRPSWDVGDDGEQHEVGSSFELVVGAEVEVGFLFASFFSSSISLLFFGGGGEGIGCLGMSEVMR